MADQALELLQKTIQQGIDAIGNFLHQAMQRPIMIIGSDGTEYYPRHDEALTEALGEFIRNLPDFEDGQYFYTKNQQRLVMKVSLPAESVCLYLLVADTTPADIVGVMEVFSPARLALSYDLRSRLELSRRLQQRTDTLFEDVFVKNNIRVDELLARHGIQLDLEQDYAVMLMDMGKGSREISAAEFRANLSQFRREHQVSVIYPLKWRGLYIAILSGIYRQRDYKELSDWNSQRLIQRWQQSFAAKYEVEFSIGVGRSYPLTELHKSYKEARIALAFRQIRGEQGFIQRYEDMGVFQELFACETGPILDFCQHTLDKLLEYDHDCDAELQTTLRALLESIFNYKMTAEKLFVHVNTVRYRCEKIAQLLAIDWDDPDVRFNLYAAIRVGDVLKSLNILQPGYIGQVQDKKESHKHQKSSHTIFGDGKTF